MSRNSKNSKRIQAARERSRARQAGNKGASQTTPLHGKSHTYRTPETLKRIYAVVATMESRIAQRQLQLRSA